MVENQRHRFTRCSSLAPFWYANSGTDRAVGEPASGRRSFRAHCSVFGNAVTFGSLQRGEDFFLPEVALLSWFGHHAQTLLTQHPPPGRAGPPPWRRPFSSDGRLFACRSLRDLLRLAVPFTFSKKGTAFSPNGTGSNKYFSGTNKTDPPLNIPSLRCLFSPFAAGSGSQSTTPSSERSALSEGGGRQ